MNTRTIVATALLLAASHSYAERPTFLYHGKSKDGLVKIDILSSTCFSEGKEGRLLIFYKTMPDGHLVVSDACAIPGPSVVPTVTTQELQQEQLRRLEAKPTPLPPARGRFHIYDEDPGAEAIEAGPSAPPPPPSWLEQYSYEDMAIVGGLILVGLAICWFCWKVLNVVLKALRLSTVYLSRRIVEEKAKR